MFDCFFFVFIEKVDQVLDDTENTESMVNQLLYRTFTRQRNFDKAVLPTGQKVWISNNSLKKCVLIKADCLPQIGQ